MSDEINANKNFVYQIDDEKALSQALKVAHALDSKERMRILSLLEERPMTIQEISHSLSLPLSSCAFHTDILKDSELIFIDYRPSSKGQLKLCSRSVNYVSFSFGNTNKEEEKEEIIEMPVGYFSDIKIAPPCGIAGKEGIIGPVDDLTAFYLPERVGAEILWFQKGRISYRFPFQRSRHPNLKEISISLELCSETVYSRNDWPSDITFWINGKEILTFTSPGDFGGRRGRLTPEYWFINSTQFGLLTEIKVNEKGSFCNDNEEGKTTLAELGIGDNPYIELTIGFKEDAKHKGGINLFGKGFGDYEQAIVMRLR